MKSGRPCPVCMQNGRCGNLAQQQINFNEALLVCDNPDCVFPMGYHDIEEYRVDSQVSDLVIDPTDWQPGQQTLNESLSFLQELLAPKVSADGVTKNGGQSTSESDLVKKTVFLQWRNNNALCWLDVLLTLLVHCACLRRLLERCSSTLPPTIPMLIATYDRALALMTKQKTKDLKNVVPSGGGCSEEPLQQTPGGNPILRRFFDSLDVYGLPGKEKVPDSVEESYFYVVNYDAHEVRDLGKQITSSEVKIIDKPEALVKLRKQLRQAAAQYKNVDIRSYHEAEKLLNCAREEMWKKLHPLMQCEKGKNDSPLIALFVLLHTWSAESSQVNTLFNIYGRWEMNCSECKKTSSMTISSKAIVTFPSVKEDFSVNNAYFVRACPSCGAANQQYRLHIEQMPECLMFHFMNGLPTCDLDQYAFERNGKRYRVRALVRYRNKPTDHFISYIRDHDAKMWMECDDLKSPICSFSLRKLQIPPSEIHLVMWERLMDRHPEGSCPNSGSTLGNASEPLKIISDPSILHSASSSSSQGKFVESPPTSDIARRSLSLVDSNSIRSPPECENLRSYMLMTGQGRTSGSRDSSRRPSRAVTPTQTLVSSSGTENDGSGERRSIKTTPSVAPSSVGSRISSKERRHSVFRSKTVDYVWEKLTSDHSITGKDAAMKAMAEHQNKKRNTSATPQLKSRLDSYLSSLKPNNLKCGNFAAYKPVGKTRDTAHSEIETPLKDRSNIGISNSTNLSVPPVTPTAPLEDNLAYTAGGRALSVDDSASIVSTCSMKSFPSFTTCLSGRSDFNTTTKTRRNSRNSISSVHTLPAIDLAKSDDTLRLPDVQLRTGNEATERRKCVLEIDDNQGVPENTFSETVIDNESVKGWKKQRRKRASEEPSGGKCTKPYTSKRQRKGNSRQSAGNNSRAKGILKGSIFEFANPYLKVASPSDIDTDEDSMASSGGKSSCPLPTESLHQIILNKFGAVTPTLVPPGSIETDEPISESSYGLDDLAQLREILIQNDLLDELDISVADGSTKMELNLLNDWRKDEDSTVTVQNRVNSDNNEGDRKMGAVTFAEASCSRSESQSAGMSTSSYLRQIADSIDVVLSFPVQAQSCDVGSFLTTGMDTSRRTNEQTGRSLNQGNSPVLQGTNVTGHVGSPSALDGACSSFSVLTPQQIQRLREDREMRVKKGQWNEKKIGKERHTGMSVGPPTRPTKESHPPENLPHNTSVQTALEADSETAVTAPTNDCQPTDRTIPEAMSNSVQKCPVTSVPMPVFISYPNIISIAGLSVPQLLPYRFTVPPESFSIVPNSTVQGYGIVNPRPMYTGQPGVGSTSTFPNHPPLLQRTLPVGCRAVSGLSALPNSSAPIFATICTNGSSLQSPISGTQQVGLPFAVSPSARPLIVTNGILPNFLTPPRISPETRARPVVLPDAKLVFLS